MNTSDNNRQKLIELFPKIDFGETRSYAQRHIELKGVDKLLSEANANESMYIKKKESFVEQYTESFTNALNAKEKAEATGSLLSFAWKAGIVGLIAGSLISGFVSGEVRGILNMIVLIAMIAIPVGLIGKLVTASKRRNAINEYERLYSKLLSIAENAGNVHGNENQTIYTKIDDIYLSSLDAAHREMVLMRRDQERQHQEALQAQLEHNRVIEQEQRLARAAQEQSARATQKLLDIEEERERRWRH